MQKKLIALAVAGLASTGAFAQSSVTVYGVADAYLAKVSANDRHSSPVVNSGGLASSRLGFKGVEDLGNGLKALFVLEYGLTLDQNSGIANGGSGGTQTRQQMVGLTGGFGTAVAGRLQTTAYDWAVKYDVLAGTAISPLQNVVTQASIGGSGGVLGLGNSNMIIGATTVGSRANNAVAYITPTFAGVTAAVNYARNLTADDANTLNSGNNNRSTLGSLTWTGGPASAGLVLAETSFDNGQAPSNVKDWALGGSYDLGVAKLSATYQSSKVSTLANANKAFSIGAAVPVTAAGTVVASFAKFQNKNVVDSDPKSFTVAYLHGLSKRTTAYAGYTRTSNGGASSDYGVAGLAPNGVGNSANALVAGLNHKF